MKRDVTEWKDFCWAFVVRSAHLSWGGVWPGAGSGCLEPLRSHGAGCSGSTGLMVALELSGPGVCGWATEHAGFLLREPYSQLSGRGKADVWKFMLNLIYL